MPFETYAKGVIMQDQYEYVFEDGRVSSVDAIVSYVNQQSHYINSSSAPGLLDTSNIICSTESLALPTGFLSVAARINKVRNNGYKLKFFSMAKFQDTIQNPGTNSKIYSLALNISTVNLFVSFWGGNAAIVSCTYEVNVLKDTTVLYTAKDDIVRDTNPPCKENYIPKQIPSVNVIIPFGEISAGASFNYEFNVKASCSFQDNFEKSALAGPFQVFGNIISEEVPIKHIGIG